MKWREVASLVSPPLLMALVFVLVFVSPHVISAVTTRAFDWQELRLAMNAERHKINHKFELEKIRWRADQEAKRAAAEREQRHAENGRMWDRWFDYLERAETECKRLGGFPLDPSGARGQLVCIRTSSLITLLAQPAPDEQP